MGKVVEITIDLTKPNSKPEIETFEITKRGVQHIYCKSGLWGNTGRRFFIPNMNKVKYRGTLKYSYRYRTEETDYAAIAKSKETADAVSQIIRYLTSDINCYQERLRSAGEYYRRNEQ